MLCQNNMWTRVCVLTLKINIQNSLGACVYTYCYILTLDRTVNQEMHLFKYAEEQRKQVNVRQLYNQVPQTAWVSSSCSWSQLGTRCRIESQRQTEGFGLSVTHGWAVQPECERSTAMVRRTSGQYVAVCPCLQLTSHTQPTSTLSRIKYERYIFIKKCVRSFIGVRHYVWLWVYNNIRSFFSNQLMIILYSCSNIYA